MKVHQFPRAVEKFTNWCCAETKSNKNIRTAASPAVTEVTMTQIVSDSISSDSTLIP